jgi:aspergillopepsin I
VYSSETAPTDLGNRVRWEPTKSSTAEKIPNSTWWIQYGDSSYAYGNVWRDTVTIADISVPGAVVESAMDVSYQLSTDNNLCGIFGLAIGLNSRVIPSQPTVINSMKPLLNAQVFTSDLKWHAEGTYSFGGIDSSRFTGDIRYVPLHENAKYWEINVTGVHIGDASIWYLFNWSSIVDTGTSLLLMDDDVVKAYYNAVPAAYYKAKYDAWVYPCNTALPDLELGFSSDNTVKIPGRYINYTALEGSVCMGGLQSNIDQGFSVLGDIFLKAIFAVFDYDGRRVGFANKVLN